jgi:hypothetical protein
MTESFTTDFDDEDEEEQTSCPACPFGSKELHHACWF